MFCVPCRLVQDFGLLQLDGTDVFLRAQLRGAAKASTIVQCMSNMLRNPPDATYAAAVRVSTGVLCSASLDVAETFHAMADEGWVAREVDVSPLFLHSMHFITCWLLG